MSVATTALVVIALLIPLAKAVQTIPRDRALSRAQIVSQSLVQSASAVSDRERLKTLVMQTQDLNRQAITLILADQTAFGSPFTPSPALEIAKLGTAINASIPDGVEVLTPAVTSTGTAVVRVVVTNDDLREGVFPAWLVLAALGLFLTALSGVVADQLARSINRPMAQLSHTIRALESGDLTARATPDGPNEVREIGFTINRLADRIGELRSVEREAIADLSHRLRTPITVLRLDIDGLRDPQEASRLRSDLDALTEAVDRLIRTARQPTVDSVASCDLIAVVAERTRFWEALAEEQGRPMNWTLPAKGVWVNVSEESLGAALDAVIGNVFSHTADDVGFTVTVALNRGRVLLSVVDKGPALGAPVATPDRRGESGSGSTGLGLSIAASTAAAAGGEFLFTTFDAAGSTATFNLPVVRTEQK